MSGQSFIIADDHPLFRSALKQAIQQSVADAQLYEAETVDQLFNVLKQYPSVELVFLDIHMPGNEGLMGLTRLQNHYPDVLVVVVSSDDQPSVIQKALDFGAAAFVPKSADLDTIKEAINQVLQGDVWLPENFEGPGDNCQTEHNRKLAKQLSLLTPQQYTVLEMIAAGKLNKQIAYDLDIKETTVKKHVSAILEKLALNNRTQAGLVFQQLKIENH